MKNIKQAVIALIMTIGIGVISLPATVGAVNVVGDACKADPSSAICNSTGNSPEFVIRIVVNTLLLLLGIASVIVIIIGGFMYTASGGDSSALTKAKNTILYAVIGVVVAMLAFAIVNFVIDQLLAKPVTTTATVITAQ